MFLPMYRKILIVSGLAFAVFAKGAAAAAFVSYPDPDHLAAKLPATITSEDAYVADENTIRLVSTKIAPHLIKSSERFIQGIAAKVDPTFYDAKDDFTRAAKLDAVKKSIETESAAIDLNKTFIFEYDFKVDNMGPGKFCIVAPTSNVYERYYGDEKWAVARYKFYTANDLKFNFYCAANAEEAQKFEQAVSSLLGRRVDVQVTARVLPALFATGDRSPHLYFLPYTVRVTNPVNQSLIFEIKR